MAIYTVSISQGGAGTVSVGDGSLLANLSVSAGRGPKGDGFTGGSYNGSTGVVTFTSNDGLGFATGDLRPDFSDVDINGGTIDGTVIGGTTPAAISGTTGQFGTSLNVDGTVTADGLVVDGDGYFGKSATGATTFPLRVQNTSTDIFAGVGIEFSIDGVNDVIGSTIRSDRTGAAYAQSAVTISTRRANGSGLLSGFKLDQNGDISFYEDTGTTPKFFWDSSAERLGIGTAAPTSPLTVVNLTGGFTATFKNSVGSGTQSGLLIDAGSTSADFAMYVRNAAASSDLFAIKGNGNVGIGTSSPTAPLEVSGSAYIRTANSAVSQVLRFDRNQATTGDIGQIQFYTSDGAGNPTEYGRITGTATTINNGIEKGHLYFSTTLNGVLAERARIDASGNVGIGTTVCDALLHANVSSAGANIAKFSDPNNRALIIKAVAAGMEIITTEESDETDADRALIFKRGTSESARIDASGRLLVGSSTQFSNEFFSSQADGNREAAVFASNGTSATVLIANFQATGTRNLIQFRASSTDVGNITTNGTTTAYNITSDYRLKEDVQPMVGASDRVLSLKPVNFAWKANGTRTDGFIAHEAQAVVPEAVTGDKDGDEMQVMDQSKLVPLLTAALQEALKEIADLKGRITALEA